MLEKNYTNPEDKGRFGFSESGTYNAPYKGESFFFALITAGMAVLSVVMFVVLRNLAAYDRDTGGGVLFMSILACAVGYLFLEIALLFAGFTLIKAIGSGYVCKYDANEEKFVANIGGTLHTIYYREVQTVHFQPRHWLWFRKVQGYDVTVKINGADEEFSITSDGYISPKSTPFYIIKERMEMIERSEYDESHRRQLDASAVSTVSLTPKTRKTPRERLEALMGQDDIMPSVGADTASKTLPEPKISLSKTSAAAVEPMQEEPLSPYDTRVSPTVLGYAADMPTVTKQPETYVGEDGRITDRDAIISRGTFCVTHSRKIEIAMYVISVLLALVGLGFIIAYIWYTIEKVAWNFIVSLMYYGWILVIGGLVFLSAAVVVMRYLIKGAECRYRANGREFDVFQKFKPDVTVLFNEVLSVNFKPRKFMWFDHGYDVEIATKSGFIRFRYVFPRLKHTIKIIDTPFQIIRSMSPAAGTHDER